MKTRANRFAVKVHFDFGNAEPRGESVWATELGEDRYRIENIPFFANANYHDVVLAKRDRKGVLQFQRLVIRSGHQTRLLVFSDANANAAFVKAKLAPLEIAGCGYEGGWNTIIAVNIPPHVDARKVDALIEAGKREGVWLA